MGTKAKPSPRRTKRRSTTARQKATKEFYRQVWEKDPDQGTRLLAEARAAGNGSAVKLMEEACGEMLAMELLDDFGESRCKIPGDKDRKRELDRLLARYARKRFIYGLPAVGEYRRAPLHAVSSTGTPTADKGRKRPTLRLIHCGDPA